MHKHRIRGIYLYGLLIRRFFVSGGIIGNDLCRFLFTGREQHPVPPPPSLLEIFTYETNSSITVVTIPVRRQISGNRIFRETGL